MVWSWLIINHNYTDMLIEIITWPALLSARLLLAAGIWLFEKPSPADTGKDKHDTDSWVKERG